LRGRGRCGLGARAPARVERLVIANSAAAIPPVEVWNTRIATVREKGLGAIVDGVLERWFTPASRESNPDKLATVRAMILENDPEGYAACCAVVRDTDLHDDLPAIRARTLVIGGTEDQATTIAQSETMAAAIPGARLARLPAAHLSNWERPDDFTALLLSFFAE